MRTDNRPGRCGPALWLALATSLAWPAAAAAAPVTPVAPVARHGATWVIQAQRLPRAEVAAQLAQLSGSAVHGDLAALAQARPVTLNWRGGSLAAAWQVLLDGEVSHARRCSAARCELWLAASPRAVAGTAIRQPDAAPLNRAQQPDPPGLFPSE